MRQQVKTFTRSQVKKGRQLIVITDKDERGAYSVVGGIFHEFERVSAAEAEELKRENGAQLLVVKVDD